MAVVIPVKKFTFDIGTGLGLGTSSGYAGGWAEYAAHPFVASWEFQLEPTVRAHLIGSYSITPSLDLFARVDAAALVLPRGSNASMMDSTWMLFAVGTRFGLL